MSFFQNVFSKEFRGVWLLGDRQYSLDFNCPPNTNTSNYLYAWNTDPYDFSSLNTLTINYAWDANFKNYSSLAINISGITASATKASEVVTILNANTLFAELFVARLQPAANSSPTPSNFSVVILPNNNRKRDVRAYISNGGAETKMRFNKKAGVADLPSFFNRHTIANRYTYSDSEGVLQKLTQVITSISVAASAVVTSASHGLTTGDVIYIVNTNSTPVINGTRTVTVTGTDTFTVPVTTSTAGTIGEWLTATQYQIVSEADLDYTAMKEDWELLRGRASGLFKFKKQNVDTSSRVVECIEYGAGAVAGDFAKKTIYTYEGAETAPTTVAEIPYVLQSGDLITPY